MNPFLSRLVVACALLLTVAGAAAQPYPNRPVRVVVPYPAGQGTDLVTRYVA